MIPEHVLAAFQLDGLTPVQVGAPWDHGARFERVVVAPATSTSAWSAKVRERFSSPGLLVARPVRATDGRVVVGGFKANDFMEGAPAARADEAIAAALAFDTAMADVAPPAVERTDVWAEADRAAWDDWTGSPEQSATGVAHLDFLACCVFSGALPPVLTDIVPSVEPRPLGYTAALALVDALLNNAVDDRVVSRWAHIPDLSSLAGRAVDFREALDDTLPAKSNNSANFARVRDLLVSA
ncbi:TIGR02569 family protein [Corynebacterium mycetoides]|uniref:TIGR02569 family protein n=2 Tax=Corynebacterium mycetoides TaxID=38302 RepID=A0A1G9QUZ4_9CORY|nr:TIGR02569 family protein [Corynebacterium mycetoides]